MSIPRTIDASLNRLAEGLRVMEDLARYVFDDAELSRSCKEIRHEARRLPDRWPAGWLETVRDVAGDVGTRIDVSDEGTRAGLWDVAVAAGHRAAEALRTIEELTKTFDADAASMVESMRYRLYDLDTRLRTLLASRRLRQWSLCVLLTESRCRRPWLEVAAAAIEAGADCLQLREKELDDADLLDRAKRLVDLARPAGCSVVINDRFDIALGADADGVHLGCDDLPIATVRRHVGRQLIIGASTHGITEANAAIAAGADVCGVGPMYPSETKSKLKAAGPTRLAEFIGAWPEVSHLAIGGIDPTNLPALLDAGCRGVATCDAVCTAQDPAGVVRVMLEMMHQALPA
ncbi:MAG: thiamine phosphate synthase [Phycisphaerales bacterium]|nr:thiamine phosphate synthase [Phycisphaerales bacterium]